MESKENLSRENEARIPVQDRNLYRADEAAYVTPLSSTIYPNPPVHAYFECLTLCDSDDRNCYEYSILTQLKQGQIKQ